MSDDENKSGKGKDIQNNRLPAMLSIVTIYLHLIVIYLLFMYG